jgi:Effector-associated domain 11
MVASNDIIARRAEIHTLIASDDIERATKRAMDFVQDFSSQRDHVNEVIVLSASYTRLDKKERQGLLDFDDAEKHRRRLLFQMLELLNDIETELANQLMAA